MHTFTVQLRYSAEFPLDMLRYDDAAPATAEDAALIDLMKDIESDRSQLPKNVAITLRSPVRAAPHTKRWESFGVLVVETDNPLSEISRAVVKPTPLTAAHGSLLSICKRDADAYDIFYEKGIDDTLKSGRVARLRAAFIEDARGVRKATPGTWRILWDGDSLGMVLPEGLTDRDFESAQDAYSVFVAKMLG